MRQVYGIYERGGIRPLYVGSTVRDLELRLRQHISAGALRHRGGRQPKKSEVRLKNLWMFNASEGRTDLEIRSLASVDSRGLALSIERAMILKLRPILNGQTSSKTPTPP